MSPLALSLHFLQAQPDRRLVELARDGHEPAFEALVRRYRKELLAYCRRLAPGSGTAEDALQQTLLQAWKALKAGADVRDVRPWLYRIAHNVSLNQLRVRPAVPREMADTAGAQEVHQLVEQRLRARAALAEMASLPALQRDVFVSTTLDGASHEEVASALGLSSGAVRGLIYRARATLRSAAAALTPSPVAHWAMRRLESHSRGVVAATEAAAGSGGVGFAAVLAKGGAVLTVAGAVVGAGTGGGIFAHAVRPHRHPVARLVAPRAAAHGLSENRVRNLSAAVSANLARHSSGNRGRSPSQVSQEVPGVRRDGGVGRDSAGEERPGAPSGSDGERGGGTEGKPDGGPSGTSSQGSAGGSGAGAASVSSSGSGPTSSSGSTVSSGGSDGGSDSLSGGSDGSSGGSDGSSGGSDGGSGSTSGSSGGTDGGTGGSSDTSISTSSGSDGGTSGGDSGSSDGGQSTSTQASGGGSGSDGGSGSPSGSGDTTTSSGSD